MVKNELVTVPFRKCRAVLYWLGTPAHITPPPKALLVTTVADS